MKSDKNNFFRSQIEWFNWVRPQIDLINSIQPQVELLNSIQDQNNLVHAALASQALPNALKNLYDTQELYKSLTPFYNLQSQFTQSFSSIPQYFTAYESLGSLAHNISIAAQNTYIPVQTLHETAQKIANAASIWNDFATSFATNIENIDILSNSESDDYIDLPEEIAKFVTDIDDSIELPSPNPEQIIHIDKKSNPVSYSDILNIILTIISLIITVCFGHASALSSEQQHKELMQQNEQQHLELLQQNERHHKELIELDKQQHKELLEQNKQHYDEFMELLSNVLSHILNGDIIPTQDRDGETNTSSEATEEQ